ncbi:MAG: WYL domain-containing protein [Treponema sp.]|nr:WYL domain-containing protein [Treponema sp.]
MLFSEVYGTYYNTMAKILEKALNEQLTADGLYSCIMENAYSESVVPITDAIEKERWQFLKFNREKNQLSPVVKNNPEMPLTNLQLQYLKALLHDKRIRLFDLDFDYFEKQLADVEPLWQLGDYEVFDKYDDGDDFEDASYKKRFRMILDAKQNNLTLDFTLRNRHGKEFKVTGIPEKIEYSEKDDKFRVMLAGCTQTHTINLGRIVALKYSDIPQKQSYSDAWDADRDTIVLELTDERNALERVSLHFANLKKKTTKIGDNKYRIELEFSRDDETEMVIRLLQFGPVIKVLEPIYIVGEIQKRLGIQLRLIK